MIAQVTHSFKQQVPAQGSPMSPIIPLTSVHTYAAGLDHSEGICHAPDGHLYVGGEAGQVYRIKEGHKPDEVGRIPGFCLGLAADGASRLYICDHASAVVWRFDPYTGQREVFSSGTDTQKARVPNWGCFDSKGTYYYSDSGGWGDLDGLIWRVRSGITEVWSEECRNFPNGMALADDEAFLYVLESNPPALVRVPIMPDGSAGHREVITELPGTVPDGVALTDEGRFVVACYRPDAILLVDPAGSVEVLAEDAQGTVLSAPTNVVFIGTHLDKIVVPNLGRWHLSTLSAPGIRGIPLAYPSAEAIGS